MKRRRIQDRAGSRSAIQRSPPDSKNETITPTFQLEANSEWRRAQVGGPFGARTCPPEWGLGREQADGKVIALSALRSLSAVCVKGPDLLSGLSLLRGGKSIFNCGDRHAMMGHG